MRIARLELYGFKSFPDRTAFEFGPGVSCVVGPNGSGKSNVVDAIRWCIGEQSARSLRGAEMIDVIFAGSADRAPVGFAEVRLTFSSDTGEPFPGEYAQLLELMVGRRLHRNGTSEYLINGVKCRRRDIVELFLDTGVGSNLYSFIAQGQVEKIVHASPMERRAILDEAAGISRYAARRAEAQQRLEATGSQLDRAADVADEMERRLKVLERQVIRAADFRRLRALIRQEEIFLSLVRYRELAADRRALREDHRKTSNEAAANRRELARRQNDLAQRREELAVVEAAANKWRDEVAELDARARELEGARSFQHQRALELDAQAERQRTEVEDAGASVQRDLAAAAEADADASDVERRMGDGEDARRAREETATRARAAREEAQAAVSAADRLQAEATSDAVRATDRIASLDRTRKELALEDTRARETIANLEVERSRRLAALEAVERAASEARAAAARAGSARAEVEALVAAAREAQEEAEQSVTAAEAELDRARVEADAAVEAAARAAEESRRAADEDLRETERAAGAAVDAARQAGRRVLEDLRQGHARRRRKLDELRAQRLESEAERARLEGEHQRLAAERRAAVAAGAPVPGLEDGRSLVERLGLDAAAAEELASRVGDRAFLPVIGTTAEATGVGAARKGATVRVLVSRHGDPRSAWEGRWSRFDSIEAAVEHYLATGGGAVAPGARMDPDGVLTLGRSGAEERAARLRQIEADLAACEEGLDAVGVALERGEEAIRALVGPVDGDIVDAALRVLAREERRQIEGAEREADDAVAEAERAGEARVDRARAAVVDAVEAVARARDDARVRGEERIAAVRGRVAVVREARGVARARLEQALEAERQASQASSGAEIAASRADGERNLAASAVREAEAAVEAGRLRIEDAAAKAARCEVDLVDARDALAEATTRAESARTDLLALRESLSEAEAREREAVAEAGAVQARADALRERLEGLRQQGAAARARATEASERQERARAAVEAMIRGATEARDASAKARREAAEVAEARGGAWDKLQRERDRVGKLKDSLQKAEADGDALQEKARALATRIAELDAAVNQAKADLEVLRGNIDDRYQVSLPGLLDRVFAGPVLLEVPPEVRVPFAIGSRTIDAVEDFRFTRGDLESATVVEAVVTANHEHRAALSRLGEVNLGALDEFGELQLRFEELVTQRGDLEASVADIRRAIAKMNRTCRQRFRDAFDRVNEFFQEVYPRLVGGGSARLSLTDEEDLLQTGVEIYVQPPGKRLQNLTLLSGGEKAMTAIALLIAIFKVKPSPFCVLDEVDAPLDEANGSRFNDIIKEMSAVSQFLVITHNRKTMECADTLYGVTMGRPGVSKLVSVDLAG